VRDNRRLGEFNWKLAAFVSFLVTLMLLMGRAMQLPP